MSTQQEKTQSPGSSVEEGGAGWDPHSRLLRSVVWERRSLK